MTISELIQYLKIVQQEVGPDAEVRLASQPNWPFEYQIDGFAVSEGILYVAEGQQIGYLPGAAANELGWR